MKTRLMLGAIGATMVLGLVSMLADSAVAGGPCGCGYGSRGMYSQDRIPYFAQHPPVYYSYVVPRPYGYSPYAYPGTVMTPERPAVVKPVMLINPFVPQKSDADAIKTTSTRRRAQVIYPASLRVPAH